MMSNIQFEPTKQSIASGSEFVKRALLSCVNANAARELPSSVTTLSANSVMHFTTIVLHAIHELHIEKNINCEIDAAYKQVKNDEDGQVAAYLNTIMNELNTIDESIKRIELIEMRDLLSMSNKQLTINRIEHDTYALSTAANEDQFDCFMKHLSHVIDNKFESDGYLVCQRLFKRLERLHIVLELDIELIINYLRNSLNSNVSDLLNINIINAAIDICYALIDSNVNSIHLSTADVIPIYNTYNT